jgi:hypothetical protein
MSPISKRRVRDISRSSWGILGISRDVIAVSDFIVLLLIVRG